jgi:hypothetical protein
MVTGEVRVATDFVIKKLIGVFQKYVSGRYTSETEGLLLSR